MDEMQREVRDATQVVMQSHQEETSSKSQKVASPQLNSNGFLSYDQLRKLFLRYTALALLLARATHLAPLGGCVGAYVIPEFAVKCDCPVLCVLLNSAVWAQNPNGVLSYVQFGNSVLRLGVLGFCTGPGTRIVPIIPLVSRNFTRICAWLILPACGCVWLTLASVAGTVARMSN